MAQWVRRDKAHWLKRDERMQRHHKLWRLDQPARNRMDGTLLVTTNDPKVFIEKAASMAVAKDHRIEVVPKGEQHVAAAERIENACRWKRAYERRMWREGLHNYLDYDQAQCLFLRGWLTVRVMLDPDSRTFVDETLFDPLTVYPRVAGKRVSRVCHVYRTTIDDLREDFGELPATFDARKDEDEVEVRSVYLNAPPYWHCVVVDGDWVKEPTGLDYWPWVLATAKGAFSHHATDWEPADQSAEHVGQGFLDAMEDAYRDLNDLATILLNLLAKQENPPMITTDPAGKPLEVDTGIGGRTPFATGQAAAPIEVGAKLQHIEALITMMQDRENKAGFSAVAWGEGAGIQSGYQASLLMHAIQNSLEAFIRCLEGFHSARYEKWLELYRDHGLDAGIEIVAKVGTTLDGKPAPKSLRGRRAWGTVLLPADVEANGTDVDVIYEDIAPQDRLALTNMAATLVSSGLVSLETARDKYVGLDDPGVESERVLADLVFKNPAVVDLLSELALRRGGRWNELQALRAAHAQQAAAGPPPGPGGPGGPPGAPGAGGIVKESMSFKDLPPALQAQMAAQAGMTMPQGGPGPGELPPGSPPPMPPPPMAPAAPGGGAGQGPPSGGPPPIPPEVMDHAKQVFATLPPEVQAMIGALPVAAAIQLLMLPPDQMLKAMAQMGGGPPGGGAAPSGPPAPRPDNRILPNQVQTGPPGVQDLTAQRLARVGMVRATR